MDLLFLGTSAATPTRTRNVSALALLEPRGKGWFLLDCGEATQHRVMQAGLSLHELQAIFITHVHGDHCYGLPGLLASAGLQGRTRPLTLVAPAGVEAWMDATQQMSQLSLPYPLQWLPTESLGCWSSEHWLVDVTELSHRVRSFAYGFTEARPESRLDQARLLADGIARGPVWGQLKKGIDAAYEGRTLRSRDYLIFPHPPRRVVVAGDNDRPELLAAACRNAQVLVHEATFSLERPVETRFGHSAAGQVAAFADSIGLPNLVLTHFSSRFQDNPERSPGIADLRAEALQHYRGGLWLAEDLARFRLDRTGSLCRVLPAPARDPRP
ncbi:ribonuclease Z [Stutzerimonas tarimensis]|uniref:Ribonuclease Z n=1 Tax=Stutzerimonas tarimensis TaxID=1507735 RepID=A0ABV7T9C4_9GAMM